MISAVSTRAQQLPATESQIRSIEQAFEIQALTESGRCDLLRVEGFSETTATSQGSLLGRLYCGPNLLQDSLCMVEVLARSGFLTPSGYDWGSQSTGYRYWLGDAASGCQVDDIDVALEDAVEVSQPIPSSALAYILRNSREIVSRGFEFARTEIPPDESVDRFLAYQDDPDLRLWSVRITPESIPEVGFAYSASFRSSLGAEGPVVTFSITSNSIAVHVIGLSFA